jgi:pseudaminic acid cytidylyltransferase
MRVAIIPARGGSKRIPRKNIKLFSGKPIISYAIKAATQSNCFDQIIVSTDDQEIAKISEYYGAAVPFLRPKELSDDHTPTTPVINHAIRWMKSQGYQIDEVCCIYSTSPLVQPKDIKDGLKMLLESTSKFVFSATTFPFPIHRGFKINEDNKAEMFWPENHLVRSQDLIPAYHDAGQFYWGNSESWLKKVNMFDEGASPLILPRYRVQDIDTDEDWIKAEYIFQALKMSL